MNANLILLLLDQREKRTVLKLNKLPMTVGRGHAMNLTIGHRRIRRKHCEQYEAENTICIGDLAR